MSSDQRSGVLLIGAGHWGNPGLDYKNIEFDDMRSPVRQAQIADCLERFLRFRPTKVALEYLPAEDAEWNEEYRSFGAGKFALTADERHQLGFRLAAMAGLDRIYGIDWHNVERPMGWERAVDFAQAHGQHHLIDMYLRGQQESSADRAKEAERLRTTSVLNQLLAYGEADVMAAAHRPYMDLAQIGDETNQVGAEVALRWYERNMMLFTNLARLAREPHDRVVLVVGHGHLPLLAHFLEGAGRFEVEFPGSYLT